MTTDLRTALADAAAAVEAARQHATLTAATAEAAQQRLSAAKARHSALVLQALARPANRTGVAA